MRINMHFICRPLFLRRSHGNSGNSATILVPSATSYRNFHNNATVNEQNCCETLIHGLLPFSHYEIKVRGNQHFNTSHVVIIIIINN